MSKTYRDVQQGKYNRGLIDADEAQFHYRYVGDYNALRKAKQRAQARRADKRAVRDGVNEMD